jgi:hypothetical protein
MHVENLGSPGDTAVRYDASANSFSGAGNRATLRRETRLPFD